MDDQANRSAPPNAEPGDNLEVRPAETARLDLAAMGITNQDIVDAVEWARLNPEDDSDNGA